jgi:hypothetical protein
VDSASLRMKTAPWRAGTPELVVVTIGDVSLYLMRALFRIVVLVLC